MKRAFVALDLDEAAVANACSAMGALSRAKGAPPGARWVRPENMHVTLKFLGSIADDAIAAIGAALPALAARPSPRLVLAAAGAFPSEARARVVILDVQDEGQLGELAAKLEAIAEREGVPREARAFHAHLTLARLAAPFDARAWLASRPHASLATTGASLTLYESETLQTGARYTPLARAAFQPAT